MRLRAWEEKDVDEIAKMEAACFVDPWSKEMLFDCLRYPYYHAFLVEEEGKIGGYCVLIALFEDSEVANIAVAPTLRGRGYAKAMMEAMHERAKGLGAERSLLEVRRGNAAAIALYEGFGYVKYGERARYYADGEDALLMEKKL